MEHYPVQHWTLMSRWNVLLATFVMRVISIWNVNWNEVSSSFSTALIFFEWQSCKVKLSWHSRTTFVYFRCLKCHDNCFALLSKHLARNPYPCCAENSAIAKYSDSTFVSQSLSKCFASATFKPKICYQCRAELQLDTSWS